MPPVKKDLFMSSEIKPKKSYIYLLRIQFWLDENDISEQTPAGKIALKSEFKPGEKGFMEFRSTLETFFRKVVLILLDLIYKLEKAEEGQKLSDS